MVHCSYNRQNGWTLLEMAVVLVISALLATVALQLLPLGTKIAEERSSEQNILQAEQALTGFARAHYRLPYADVDGDGTEDSGGQDGLLPYATLGLPLSAAIAYSVNSGLSSDVDGYLYHPTLPSSTTVSSPPVRSNGLDLCVLLGNMQKKINDASGVGYAAAFALSQRRHIDGINTAPLVTMTIPGTGTSVNPSLLSSAVGIGELYVRIDCPSRLNRAFASVQSARAAQSAYLLARHDADIAEFYIKVADLEDEFNRVAIGFSAFNIATATTELALSAAGAVADIVPPTDLAKAIIAATQAIVAAIQLGLSGKELDLAIQSQQESEATLTATRHHAEHARQQRERMKQLRDSTVDKSLQLDQAGLNP